MALALGTTAGAMLTVCAAAILTTALGDRPGTLTIGPLDAYTYSHAATGVGMSIGPGALLIALAVGFTNAIAAALLRRRAAR
jgi:hypothetical protein